MKVTLMPGRELGSDLVWSRLQDANSVLATRAQENISKGRDKLRCKDIEVFASDAGSFKLGPDITTIHFQNPFVGTVLESVLTRIIASYNENPRALRIVCNLPRESAFFSIIGEGGSIYA
jgi:hypothetical protein